MPFGEENIISLPLFFCHTKCYTRHNESPQFCPVFHAFGSPAKPRLKGNMYMENEYIIEMLNITKEFPGIKANDNITLQLKKWRNPCSAWRKRCRKINPDEYSF